MSARVTLRAKVRTGRQFRTGETNGRPWRIDSISVLDGDDNKVDLNVDEGSTFEVGSVYDFTCDVSASGGRLRFSVADAAKVADANGVRPPAPAGAGAPAKP